MERREEMDRGDIVMDKAGAGAAAIDDLCCCCCCCFSFDFDFDCMDGILMLVVLSSGSS